MKKRSFIGLTRNASHCKFLSWGMGVFALMFVSCADVYDDDESFSSDVRGETLLSPSIDDITVTPSTDGSITTLAWPVVHGAAGYECSVYDVTNPDVPMAVVEKDTIDGCSLDVARAEDTDYRFYIRTIGNTKLSNKDAETTTEVAYTSFVASVAEIPANTDLYQYFQGYQFPEESAGEMPFDLVAGGQYTLSGILDFGNHNVTLRCKNKANPATITYGEASTIRTSAPMTLKNLNFDCSASTKETLGLSETPDESINGALPGSQFYNIQGAIYITNCNFKGVQGRFFYDNNVKYCLETLLIDNTIVEFTPTDEGGINGNAYIHLKQGFINTLNTKNSTFYSTTTSVEGKYFIQYTNSCRCDRGGYTRNAVMHSNCTFYNIVKAGQWANYSGFAGRNTSDWVMTNNIFVDSGNKQIARRFLGGRQNQPTATFGYNTYMFDGEYENTEGYDVSGTNIEEDPMFANPANGDFTVNGATQLERRTGDPRWLPAVEE